MTTKTDPGSLLVLSFDDSLKAREAFLAFQRLQKEEVLLVLDAVFFDVDEAGHARVTETIDATPAGEAANAGLWGALIGTVIAGPVGTLVGGAISAGLGALTAKLIDLGIPDATVKEIETSLGPKSSALAMLVSHVKEAELERELGRFQGAKLLRSDLAPETVGRLREALAGKPS
ncbi:MAG: DUF1269 domain-containing protein [Deltaproteobacteria bacterium]|nr:DUF1269 domain-containing protein [Deltaproteobacteria bacterium]